MTEWIIALGAIATILLICSVALAKRIIAMYDDMKKLERSNADLRYSVKFLKDENRRLQNSVSVTTDPQEVTKLKWELHLKQEKIEALQMKLKREHQLLNQKWNGMKTI